MEKHNVWKNGRQVSVQIVGGELLTAEEMGLFEKIKEKYFAALGNDKNKVIE